MRGKKASKREAIQATQLNKITKNNPKTNQRITNYSLRMKNIPNKRHLKDEKTKALAA